VLQKTSSEHDVQLKAHTEGIKKCQDSIAEMQKKMSEESGKLKAVYDIFELNEAKMKQVLGGPTTPVQAKGTGQERKPSTSSSGLSPQLT
jgi:hypothetical protein